MISRKAIEMIIKHEVGGRAVYEKGIKSLFGQVAIAELLLDLAMTLVM